MEYLTRQRYDRAQTKSQSATVELQPPYVHQQHFRSRSIAIRLIFFIFFFWPFSVIIDLSDLRGAVKNLTDHQSSNGSEFLNERETFILVRVESMYQIFKVQLLYDKQ